MRLVNIENLKPGDIPARAIYDRAGRLLAADKTPLTDSIITGLVRFRIPAIYIEDEISKGIDISSPLSEKLISKLFDAMDAMDLDALIDGSKEMVATLSDNLYENDMKVLASYDHYTMAHSINVAIFAIVVAKTMGLKEADVLHVAQAAILHDIGKLDVPIEIVTKPGKLTLDEYEVIKKHSDYGYDRLKDRFDVYSVVRVGVLEHHENENGTGYPKGLKGDQIHVVGKILHVADVFDALTTKRSYKEAWTYLDALKYITQNAEKMFDMDCVMALQKSIPIFPKGQILTLSNGEQCIVVRNVLRHSLRPVVRIISTGEEVLLYRDPKYKNVKICI